MFTYTMVPEDAAGYWAEVRYPSGELVRDQFFASYAEAVSWLGRQKLDDGAEAKQAPP